VRRRGAAQALELDMEERRRAHRQWLQRNGNERLTMVGTVTTWLVLPARLDGARGHGQGELGLRHRSAKQRRGEAECLAVRGWSSSALAW
jgi:hypothetical protein